MTFESKLFREVIDKNSRNDDKYRGELRDKLALLIVDITGQTLPPQERVVVPVTIHDEKGAGYTVELSCTGPGMIYPQASVSVCLEGDDEAYLVDLSALPGDVTHADRLLTLQILDALHDGRTLMEATDTSSG